MYQEDNEEALEMVILIDRNNIYVLNNLPEANAWQSRSVGIMGRSREDNCKSWTSANGTRIQKPTPIL